MLKAQRFPNAVYEHELCGTNGARYKPYRYGNSFESKASPNA